MASKDVDLQKPTHPTPIGGGSSIGLAYRDILAETGRAEALPSEPPKTGGTNEKAAGPAGKLRLSSQDVSGTPIPITPFFDVTGAV